MRYFKDFLGRTWSEKDIEEEYWPHWKEDMLKAGKANQISLENCIDEWRTVNWAVEVNKPQRESQLEKTRKEFINGKPLC